MATYKDRPSILENNRNGSYTYRWGFNSIIEDNGHSSGELWQCKEVVVWSPLTSNKITQAVVAALWDVNREQKLINEYNAAKLNLYNDDTAAERIAAYVDFLNQRNQIKEQIATDCATFGIE